MSKPSALLVTLDAVRRDPALAPSGRGARKILVTEIRRESEADATDVTWQPPAPGSPCPVQIMPDTEVAVFNQHASQDRHRHLAGTEIYMVLEGRMTIEVEGHDYALSPGDMIVVNSGATHQVKPEGTQFLCRVVTTNCGGAADKEKAEGRRQSRHGRIVLTAYCLLPSAFPA